MKKIELTNILTVEPWLVEKVRSWRNSDDIRKYMLTQHTIEENGHLEWIKKIKKSNNYKFYVVFYEDRPIGAVYLQNISPEQLTAEWGFYIGEEDYRGRGLSKNILLALLELYFEQMKHKVLLTRVLSTNIAALKVYQKFNFREIGRSVFTSVNEVILLEFTDKEWENLKVRMQGA